MNARVIHAPDSADFATTGAEQMKDVMMKAIENHGSCILALSGGNTPEPIYKALGQMEDIPWEQVSLFLVDERWVPPSDERSNASLIIRTFPIDRIPASQMLFPKTELPLEQGLIEYSERIAKLIENHPIDLLTLGMGDDGHIASLFPPLQKEWIEGPAMFVHTTTDVLPVRDRISLTIPFIERAEAWFTSLGTNKEARWNEMQMSTEGVMRWPLKSILEKTDSTVLVGW